MLHFGNLLSFDCMICSYFPNFLPAGILSLAITSMVNMVVIKEYGARELNSQNLLLLKLSFNLMLYWKTGCILLSLSCVLGYLF